MTIVTENSVYEIDLIQRRVRRTAARTPRKNRLDDGFWHTFIDYVVIPSRQHLFIWPDGRGTHTSPERPQ